MSILRPEHPKPNADTYEVAQNRVVEQLSAKCVPPNLSAVCRS